MITPILIAFVLWFVHTVIFIGIYDRQRRRGNKKKLYAELALVLLLPLQAWLLFTEWNDPNTLRDLVHSNAYVRDTLKVLPISVLIVLTLVSIIKRLLNRGRGKVLEGVSLLDPSDVLLWIALALQVAYLIYKLNLV